MIRRNVLAVGAHPDDIELGCGGALARYRRDGAEVTMLVMTNGLMGPGKVRLRATEAKAAAEVLDANLIMAGFKDGELDASSKTVGYIEKVIADVNPDIVYTHSESDSHQDHRNTAAATLSAARNIHSVVHFQSPSTRNFLPVFFVGLDEEDLELKIQALNAHASQVANSARVELDAIRSSAVYWGSRSGILAEPFEVSRLLSGKMPERPIASNERSHRFSVRKIVR